MSPFGTFNWGCNLWTAPKYTSKLYIPDLSQTENVSAKKKLSKEIYTNLGQQNNNIMSVRGEGETQEGGQTPI